MNVSEIQPGDHVILKLEDSYTFDGKIGVYVKTLSEKEIEELIDQNRWDDLCGPIVINVQSVKGIHFNSWRKDTVPKEERKWLFMKEEEIVIRTEATDAGPLSIEEVIELELSQMANPPYARISYLATRNDKKCWIERCEGKEHDGIWFNIWGSGVRIPVCKNHFDEHGKITWCDDIFIKLKKNE